MEAVASSSKNYISISTSPVETVSEAAPVKSKQKGCEDICECICCNLKERYDYKGSKPPFAKHLSFTEDCYIMKDPFNPTKKSEILILGANCSICKNFVCIECSLFYVKRFCKICALKNMQHFPLRLQDKITDLNQNNDEEI